MAGKRKRASAGGREEPSQTSAAARPPPESSFASVESILRAFATSETSALGDGLRQLSRACSTSPTPGPVREYLQRTPVAQEVLRALQLAQDANSVHLLSACFNCLASILSLLPSSSTSGPTLVDAVLSDHSTAISRSFAPGRSEATASALRFLTSCAEWDEGKLAALVWQKGVGWDAQTVGRMMTTRGPSSQAVDAKRNAQGKGQSTRHHMRFLVVRLVATLLGSSVIGSSAKVSILGLRGFANALFRELPGDDYDMVAFVLTSLWETVLRDESWPPGKGGRSKEVQDGRWGFLTEDALEALVKLLDRGQDVSPFSADESVSSLAKQFLSGLVAVSSSTGRRSQPKGAVLARLLKILPPTRSLDHQDLVLAILRAQPSLASSLWRRHSPTQDIAADVKWIASVGFATKIIMLPLPPDFFSPDSTPDHIGVPTLMAQCLPTLLTKDRYAKMLQHGNHLVVFCALAMLLAGLRKALEIVERLEEAARSKEETGPKGPWNGLLASFRGELRAVLPDWQVLVAVLSKAPGLALEHFTVTSRAAGVGANDEEDDDDPSVSVDLMGVDALAALSLYRRILPESTSHRFDFSKLAPIFLQPTSEPTTALAQVQILELLRGSARTDAPPTSGFLLTLFSLVIGSPLGQVKLAAKRTVEEVVAVSPIFQDRPGEIVLMLESLEALKAFVTPDQVAEGVRTVDGAVRTCMKAPLMYFEAAEDLAVEHGLDSAPSAFLMAFKAQLTVASRGNEVRGNVLASTVLVNLAGTTGELQTTKAVSESLEGTLGPTVLASDVFAVLEGRGAMPDGAQSDLLRKALPLTFGVVDLLASPAGSLPNPSSSDNPDGPRAINLCLCALADASRKADAKRARTALTVLKQLAVDEPARRQVFLSAKGFEAFCDLSDRNVKLELKLLGLCVPSTSDVPLDRAIKNRAREYIDKALVAPELVTLICVACTLWPILDPADRTRSLSTACVRASKEDPDELACAAAEELFSLCDNADIALSPATNEALDGLLRLASARGTTSALRQLARACHDWPEDGARAKIPAIWRSCIEFCLDGRTSEVFATVAEIVRRWPKAAKTVRKVQIDASLAGTEGVLQLLDAFLTTGSDVSTWPPFAVVCEAAVRALFGPTASSDVAVRSIAARMAEALSKANLIDVEAVERHLSVDGLYPIHAEAVSTLAAVALVEPKRSSRVLLAGVQQALKWIVRRFAEDDELDQDTLNLTVALCDVVRTQARDLPPHPQFADPVVAAALQKWLGEPSVITLCTVLCQSSGFREADVVRHLGSLFANADFKLIFGDAETETDKRAALIVLVRAFVQVSPEAALRAGTVEALIVVYRGSLDPIDVEILGVTRELEVSTGISLQSACAKWRPKSATAVDSPLDSIVALDSEWCYRSCLFVLGQTTEGPAYDPDFVLPMLASALDSNRLTTPRWMAVAQTNLLGLVVCASVGWQKRWRLAADRLLSRSLALIKGCRTPEANQLALPLEHLQRCSLRPTRVSPTIALFIARSIEILATPTSPHFMPVATFLLQRPVFDLEDAPLFYGSMFSEADRGSADREWILGLFKDGLATQQDFRVLARRQIPELIVSLTALTEEHGGVVLQILERATRHPDVAKKLVAKSGLCIALERLPLKSAQEQADVLAILVHLLDVAPSLDPASLRGLVACLARVLGQADRSSHSKAVELIRGRLEGSLDQLAGYQSSLGRLLSRLQAVL